MKKVLTNECMIFHNRGKVALEYLRLMQNLRLELPRQTWVLDSQPGTVAGDPHSAKETLATLKQLPQVRETI